MKDLFITLLNMSISATWLIFAVVLVRLCLDKAPKWIRGVLWGMVALRLVVPFALESPISLVPDLQISVEAPTELEAPLVEATEDVKNTEQAVKPPVVDMPVVTPSENSPVVDIPSPDILPTTPGVTVGEILLPDEPIKEPDIQTPVITPDEEPEPKAEDKKGVDIAFIVAVIWCIGTLAMAVYCVGSYWRLKLKLREAVLVEDGVYESDRTKSAFVLGIIKPRIYLPRTLPAEDREYVIAHERVHIGRFDHILKPLGFLILALHWYNPTVWLAYILFCRDTELACDEKVIKGYSVEQIKGYSRALVACGEGHSRILVCPIAFGEVGIKERVKNILNYKKPAFWIVVGAVALCIIVAVCFMTVRGDKETGASADPTEQTETDGTEVTDGTEESDKPTESTEPTAEPTEDPTEDPTEEPTDMTEPTPTTDDGDVGSDFPEYSYEVTESKPTGNRVDFERIFVMDGNGVDPLGNLAGVIAEIQNTTETSEFNTKCYMGFDFIYTYEELKTALDEYGVKPDGTHDFAELYDFSEEFFDDKVLVSTFRSFSAGRLDYSLEGIYKDGNALTFYISTDVYRSGRYYPDVIAGSARVYEIDRSALDGIDTVRLYAEDNRASSGGTFMPGVYQDPNYLVVSTKNAETMPKDGEPLDFTVGFNKTGDCKYMPMWKDRVTGRVDLGSGKQNVYMKERVYSEYSNYGLNETFETIGFGDYIDEISRYDEKEFYEDKTLFMLLNDSSRHPIDVTAVVKSGNDIYIRITLDHKKRIENDSIILLELNREDVKNADVVYYYLSSAAENTIYDPVYNYVVKTSPVSGQSVKLDTVLTRDNFYYKRYTDFINPTMVKARVQKVNETYVYSKEQMDCNLGFDFIYSYASLCSAIENYRTGDIIRDDPFEEFKNITESDFEDKVLVAVYRMFNANNLDYEIEKTVRTGNELHFAVRTDLYRKDSVGEPVIAYSLRIYWIDREAVEGITTVSLYVEDMHPNYPILSPCAVHKYYDATCSKPATCKVCGAKKNETLAEHTYADATCTKPATCKLCGVTKGDPLGHGAMSFATCSHNGKCLVCGAVTEAALGHKFVNNICIRGCCDSVRKNKDPSVKYVYRDSAEDLVIDVLDGAISFYGSFDIIDGRVKITCKMKECDDLILWDRSLVKCYVNGVLTDKGNAVSFGAKNEGDEWDECTFYIPYTEDGEYLISLRYGDPTMPYTVTVSFPVLTMIQMM